jgi:Ca2+-binding EF-hand superfamily protein
VDPNKKEILHETLQIIFDAIDSDKSNSVSKIEFGHFFKSLNIEDQETADYVFNEMDVNKDLSLDKEGKYFKLLISIKLIDEFLDT